jgi:hypothetical protein
MAKAEWMTTILEPQQNEMNAIEDAGAIYVERSKIVSQQQSAMNRQPSILGFLEKCFFTVLARCGRSPVGSSTPVQCLIRSPDERASEYELLVRSP